MRGHFRSRDKDGAHTIRSAIAKNPMLHANLTALCFVEAELRLIEVLHCGNTDFRPFLFLWPWPWPNDLHIQTWPVSQEIYWMCKHELPTSRLSKVIVWHTYIHTYRQTYTTEIIYHAASWVISNSGYIHRFIYSLLDAVPPIHAESSHVATDKVPSM